MHVQHLAESIDVEAIPHVAFYCNGKMIDVSFPTAVYAMSSSTALNKSISQPALQMARQVSSVLQAGLSYQQ